MRVSVAHDREIRELVEDVVEHICDENLLSGELVWTMVAMFATAKLAQTKGFVGP